jgi:Ca2+-binding EF-hand superfamily protein
VNKMPIDQKIQREIDQISSSFYLQMGLMNRLQSNGVDEVKSFSKMWNEYWDRGVEIYQKMGPEDSNAVDQVIARTLRHNLPEDLAERSVEKIMNSLAGYKGYKCIDFEDPLDLYAMGIAFDSMKKVS